MNECRSSLYICMPSYQYDREMHSAGCSPWTAGQIRLFILISSNTAQGYTGTSSVTIITVLLRSEKMASSSFSLARFSSPGSVNKATADSGE